MQALYSFLNEKHYHWDREDARTIWVALSGYKVYDEAYDSLMTAAKKAKAVNVDAIFDGYSGKTFFYFQHKKN